MSLRRTGTPIEAARGENGWRFGEPAGSGQELSLNEHPNVFAPDVLAVKERSDPAGLHN